MTSICDISPDPVLSQIEKKITESKTAQNENEADSAKPEVVSSEPEVVSSEPEVVIPESEAKLEHEIEPETETETLDNSEDSLKSPILSEKSEKLPVSLEITDNSDEKKDLTTKGEAEKSVPECTEVKNVETKSLSDKTDDKTDFDYLNGEQFSDSRTVTDMKDWIFSVKSSLFTILVHLKTHLRWAIW